MNGLSNNLWYSLRLIFIPLRKLFSRLTCEKVFGDSNGFLFPPFFSFLLCFHWCLFATEATKMSMNVKWCVCVELDNTRCPDFHISAAIRYGGSLRRNLKYYWINAAVNLSVHEIKSPLYKVS